MKFKRKIIIFFSFHYLVIGNEAEGHSKEECVWMHDVLFTTWKSKEISKCGREDDTCGFECFPLGQFPLKCL